MGAADGSRELGAPGFTVADLVGGIVWPEGIDVGLVEGVGGPRSPDQRRRRQRRPRARSSHPTSWCVVADAGLGTINAVRLSVAAFADFPVVVALNRFTTEPLPERNRAHLVERDGLDVVTEPRSSGAPPPTVVR